MKDLKKVKAAQREKVLRLLDKGWDTIKILHKYPDLTKQQIAAYKAWRTMGKY